MRQSQGIEVLDAGSLPETSMIATAEWCGVVVCCILNKNDLLAVINFLVLQTAAIKEKKTVRVMAFNSIPNQKLQGVLLQKGCSEILEFKVTGKTFLHKIKRHLMLVKDKNTANDAEEDSISKSVRSVDGADSSPTGSENLTAKKLHRAGKTDQAASQGPSVEVMPALSHGSDYWLMRAPPDARRLMGRWMIELTGPSPSIGEWVQIPQRGASTKGQSVYEWKVNKAAAKFLCPTGRWLFIGRQVEFAWRANRWRFVGDKLSLSFHEGNESYEVEKAVAHRFIAESSNELKIAANSDSALAKKADIEETLLGDAHRAHQVEAKKSGGDYAEKLDIDDSAHSSESLEFDPDNAQEENLDPAFKLDSDSVENADDFKFSEQKREGSDLSGTFEQPTERKELSITLDKPREGSELSVTLDKPHEGNELSVTLDKPHEGNELSVTLDRPHEGKVLEFATGEEKSREIGGDAKRDNIFNNGPGLTQGHKSDSIRYDEEFSTADDAFKPVGLKSQLNASAADTLDFQDRHMTLRVAIGGLTAKSTARLEILTVNLTPPGSVSGLGTIVNVEAEAETGAHVVVIELTDSMIEAYVKIQDAMENRQMNILRFLKLAKGA